MNGLNTTFIFDPIWFIRQRAINSIAWFMQNQIVAQTQIAMLNMFKSGYFDLQQNNQQCNLAFIGNILPVNDQILQAYWCPFIQGNILPGFVDIPIIAPQYNFMFTAAMNGCALVATQLDQNTLRVYHDQHPGVAGVNPFIVAQGHQIRSMITFNDYAQAHQQHPQPNAFNFLHYRNGGWRYVIQPQLLDMMARTVTLNPALEPQILDV